MKKSALFLAGGKSISAFAMTQKLDHPANRVTLLFLLCLSLTLSLHAGDLTITPSKPQQKGTDIVTVTDEGGTKTPVSVVIDGDEEQLGKAGKISDAINAAKIPGVTAEVNQTFENVKVTGAKKIDGVANTLEDKDKVDWQRSTDSPNESVLAQVDLHLRETFATLAGIDPSGNAASYTAGFELSGTPFSDIFLSTNLQFSDLTNPTLTGLLQQEFTLLESQLQMQEPSLASSLYLDLAKSAIVFQPVGNITSISATNGTTDVALVSTLSVGTVPEPSSLVMMGSGLLLGLCRYTRIYASSMKK